jgi:phosphoribosyl 1,2-cyclic phosphodiesterase
LRTGPYPRALQQRIRGGKGHLDNHSAASLAAQLVHGGLRTLILAHLSQENNTPELARRTVGVELRRAGYQGALDVAPQDTVTRFSVSRSGRVQQIDLF